MEKIISLWIITFFVYGFAGWIWESLICPLVTHHRIKNSGFLNGPIVPIYGVGALSVALLFPISETYLGVFIGGGFVACLIEYLTSWSMEKLYHRRWWDYSDKAFQINGRVCLEGFLVFGLFSVVTVKFMHPALLHLLARYHTVMLIVVATALSTLFVLDVMMTVIALSHLDEHLDEMKEELIKVIDELEETSKNWSAILEKNRTTYHELLKQKKYNERRIVKAFPQIINKKKKE